LVDVPHGASEKLAYSEKKSIVGVDEVGKGCIAGPVYAAAVMLDIGKLNLLSTAERSYIRDSKTLSFAQRTKAILIIKKIIKSSAVGCASVIEIETIGIQQATYTAMNRAVSIIIPQIDLLLVDGRHQLPNYPGRQEAIIKGDRQSFSIAAASILAKQSRDIYMHKKSNEYPVYGFSKHVGYGTKMHMGAIKKHGPCELHRNNFEPIKSYQLIKKDCY
jgi:ribonuclease HII